MDQIRKLTEQYDISAQDMQQPNIADSSTVLHGTKYRESLRTKETGKVQRDRVMSRYKRSKSTTSSDHQRKRKQEDNEDSFYHTDNDFADIVITSSCRSNSQADGTRTSSRNKQMDGITTSSNQMARNSQISPTLDQRDVSSRNIQRVNVIAAPEAGWENHLVTLSNTQLAPECSLVPTGTHHQQLAPEEVRIDKSFVHRND